MQTLNIKVDNYKGEKRIPIRRAIAILAKNGVQVDEDEAASILNFLYHIAKIYSKAQLSQYTVDLKETSNFERPY